MANKHYTREEAEAVLQQVVAELDAVYLKYDLHGIVATANVNIIDPEKPEDDPGTRSSSLFIGCNQHNIASAARFFANGTSMEDLALFTQIFQYACAQRFRALEDRNAAHMTQQVQEVPAVFGGNSSPPAAETEEERLLKMPLPKGGPCKPN